MYEAVLIFYLDLLALSEGAVFAPALRARVTADTPIKVIIPPGFKNYSGLPNRAYITFK